MTALSQSLLVITVEAICPNGSIDAEISQISVLVQHQVHKDIQYVFGDVRRRIERDVRGESYLYTTASTGGWGVGWGGEQAEMKGYS